MKKGDRVEVITQNTAASYLQIGDVGEVTFFDNTECEEWVAVEFDFDLQDAHSCDGHCKNGWWIPVKDLKVIN